VRARLATAVLVLVALAVPAVAVAGQEILVPSYLDYGQPEVRPHEILLSEDGTLALYGIKYRSYGGRVAEATGRGYTRGCVPDCAQGKVRRPRAKIRLSRITWCEAKPIYARLQYTLTGPIPKGLERHASFDLRPVDEHGKPVC
jgi:hypothetical protein